MQFDQPQDANCIRLSGERFHFPAKPTVTDWHRNRYRVERDRRVRGDVIVRPQPEEPLKKTETEL